MFDDVERHLYEANQDILNLQRHAGRSTIQARSGINTTANTGHYSESEASDVDEGVVLEDRVHIPRISVATKRSELATLQRNIIEAGQKKDVANHLRRSLLKSGLPKASKFAAGLRNYLAEYLRRLNDLRANINPRLNSLFNADIRQSRSLRGSLVNLDPTSGRLRSNDDVIEVLSVNRNLPHRGPEAIAAILTKANGDLATITAKGLVTTAEEDYRDSTVIRYDLSTSPSSSPTYPVVQQAQNFADQIKNALYFREEHDRYFEVKTAHERTFGWLFEESDISSGTDFRRWLHRGTGCFWVNGKAGSGKSTLMKYIYKRSTLKHLLRSWAEGRQLVIATFFFWNAGQPLQKSHEGLLRDLLHQILDARPDLTPTLFPRSTKYLLRRSDDQEVRISEQELQAALPLLQEHMPDDLAVFLLIDGVDEYVGNHLAFSKSLARISQQPWIKILVSSRPVPECFHVFSDCPNLRLQDLTREDIANYIEDELMEDKLFVQMEHLEEGFAQELKETLVDKSSGVFLWIVLVVLEILLGLVHYEDKNRLVARVDALPVDLEDLYDHMFSKMSPDYQREGSLLLQLVSRAQEIQSPPLTALQFTVALSYLDDARSARRARRAQLHNEAVLIDALAGKLRSRCCGLVEVQDRGIVGLLTEPKAVFLHRTVYDYLRNEAIWFRLVSLCDISVKDKDHCLAVACTRVLEHRLSQLSFTRKYVESSENYFIACIQYCRALSFTGDKTHLDCLIPVDQVFQQFCRHDRNTLKAEWLYDQAWKKVAVGCGYHTTSIFPKDASSDLTTVLGAAGFGLIDWFTRLVQLGWETVRKPNLNTVLTKVLDCLHRDEQGSELARNHIRAIDILLKAKANPNAPPPDCPWEYWMSYLYRPSSLITKETVEATLLLLQAGADPYLRLTHGRLACENLVEALQLYQADTIDQEVAEMAEKILVHFGVKDKSAPSVSALAPQKAPKPNLEIANLPPRSRTPLASKASRYLACSRLTPAPPIVASASTNVHAVEVVATLYKPEQSLDSMLFNTMQTQPDQKKYPRG